MRLNDEFRKYVALGKQIRKRLDTLTEQELKEFYDKIPATDNFQNVYGPNFTQSPVFFPKKLDWRAGVLHQSPVCCGLQELGLTMVGLVSPIPINTVNYMRTGSRNFALEQSPVTHLVETLLGYPLDEIRKAKVAYALNQLPTSKLLLYNAPPDNLYSWILTTLKSFGFSKLTTWQNSGHDYHDVEMLACYGPQWDPDADPYDEYDDGDYDENE